MRSRYRIVVSSVTVAALATTAAPAFAQTDTTSTFTISNITDFHGYWQETKRVPGAAKLKCSIDKAAEGKTHILTSSGDNIGASPFASMLLEDQPTLDILNLMKVQVSAVGNHELDKGAEDFSTRVVESAGFDYLAANAETLKGAKDYVVKDLDGAKVAFVGTITADMPNLVNPDSIAGITWNDPVKATNNLAKKLKETGEADVVVALVHEGGIKADQFSKDVDIAFLGHSHQKVLQQDALPLLIQAGEYGKNLANVEVTYDKATKKVTFGNVELLDADAIRACDTPQPEIDAIVNDAAAKASVEGDKVVGTADADFYRAGDKESQLNNFIANVTRIGVGNNSSVKPDLAVMNAGGVRAELEKGDVTYAEAFAIQPFGGENTYVELKGSDVVAALEQQWRDDKDRPMFPLGVSDNVSYTYDPTAPVGAKVTSVTIDGAPLDPNKTYIVAGSTFILGGGDSFEAFTRGTKPVNLGYVDLNALVEFLASDQKKTPRTSQSNVGVHIPAPLKAGEKATIELSSLLYEQGETATTATVKLGDASATAPIKKDNGGATANEYGVATVEINVPAQLAGTQELRITTDAGTDVVVPVEVAAAEPAPTNTPTPTPTPASTPTPAPSGSSSEGQAPLVAIIAGLLGALSLLTLLLAKPIDSVLGPIAKI